MELENFTLKIGNKILLQGVNIDFPEKSLSHILGNNGVGKSSFGKACVGMLKSEGKIIGNENILLIGSSSNIPEEFCLKDICIMLKKRFAEKKIKDLYMLLDLNTISDSLSIKKMSDGQKQKIKLFVFLSSNPKVIIFDEFTNTLDKNSALDLYRFIIKYIEINDITVINITHNLSDLEYMSGNYFYISNRDILKIDSKQEVIEKYIRGE